MLGLLFNFWYHLDMFERTPLIISDKIKELCAKIDKNSKPIFLDVEKLPHSLELDCYENVTKQIAKEGGKVQHGWQIWEWPGIMIEAEFHAVWVDRKGVFHDITPKQIDRINKILFLPDSSRTYEGRQIDNERMPIQDDPLIDEFIDNAHKHFLEMNHGELASFHGYVELSPEMRIILIRQNQLMGTLQQKYPLDKFL
jgi:hypothetical protein